jgi:hypothetical protein
MCESGRRLKFFLRYLYLSTHRFFYHLPPINRARHVRSPRRCHIYACFTDYAGQGGNPEDTGVATLSRPFMYTYTIPPAGESI